jgi:hypothetical protein
MTGRLSRWGVGPQITISLLLTTVLAGVATWLWMRKHRLYRLKSVALGMKEDAILTQG